MTRFIHLLRPIALAMLMTTIASALQAEPLRYQLDSKRSQVGFSYQLLGADTKGRMQVKSADIRIDLDQLANSTAQVTLDVRQAKAGFILATQALKSDTVLDAARFPDIRFTSTAIRLNGAGRLSDGAKIDGNLMVRGQSRPITLSVDLYRAPGSAASDLSKLSFRLRGTLDRNAFGASGYPELVGARITIDILAYVNRAT